MNSLFKFFLSILLILVFSGFRQSEDKAVKLLKESFAYLNELKDISARFHYQLESPRTGKIAQNGLIMFQDLKYVLKMENYDIYFDGSSHTLYSSKSNQYKIMAYNPSEGIGLVHFMYSVYTKKSKSEYQGLKELNGVLFHKIHLKMLDSSVPYNEAVLWMNPDTKLIEKISYIDLNKTITTYIFSDIIINPGYEHRDFIFDTRRFPGAEEIDED